MEMIILRVTVKNGEFSAFHDSKKLYQFWFDDQKACSWIDAMHQIFVTWQFTMNS